ncbi:ubiquinol-cytochrome c reductase iron-sulfur subunit [Ktedonobacter racemifer]|uniref:Rieske (2Fe-2S) iron-sulfur domain protein protein n=1 Tax=Ktedonobacter racemifer DSM 44963 TaxID=485913 RepID=D6TNQ8_KTERA|nr:Rieske 2Fe-2S domain-containing protein [Ktedonobacter racemifer]EFH85444.1 Rieske (2Fe-2S) iron-sulfur domain protein protein [Ktedonobacter racemifer DSM 44963]
MSSNGSHDDMQPITPQQYEILHGGGAEAAEIARQRLSRRRFLRRSMLAVWGISTTAAVAGALYFMYPTSGGDFGSAQNVGKKTDFPAAKPEEMVLNEKGVFYIPAARSYLVHLANDAQYLLSGQNLQDQFQLENVVHDGDGSTWVALYQRCVHLGCTVPFRNDCVSFKCPCHGSHYNVNGEFLDGPAPRSLDRFDMNFKDGEIIINTGTINSNVQHPDATTQLLPKPTKECSAGG